MKTQFKLFVFVDKFEIPGLVNEWLKNNNVTILYTDSVVIESQICHFVYYIENPLPIPRLDLDENGFLTKEFLTEFGP